MQNTIRDLSELGRLDRTQSPKQAYILGQLIRPILDPLSARPGKDTFVENKHTFCEVELLRLNLLTKLLLAPKACFPPSNAGLNIKIR